MLKLHCDFCDTVCCDIVSPDRTSPMAPAVTKNLMVQNFANGEYKLTKDYEICPKCWAAMIKFCVEAVAC